MRQLGYTRVSTTSQDAQLQLDALLADGLAQRDVFADVTSGSKTAVERPAMKKLLEYAEAGDTVVVWRVDRLGRSLMDVLSTVNLMRERGIQIRSISDGIDPATPTGRLMLNMLATLAEYERELIVERVNAGIAAAKQNGTRFGRPLSNPDDIAEKLAVAADARAKGRTAEQAARLVGWSRATLYRHQQAHAARKSTAAQGCAASEAGDGPVLRQPNEMEFREHSPDDLQRRPRPSEAVAQTLRLEADA